MVQQRRPNVVNGEQSINTPFVNQVTIDPNGSNVRGQNAFCKRNIPERLW